MLLCHKSVFLFFSVLLYICLLFPYCQLLRSDGPIVRDYNRNDNGRDKDDITVQYFSMLDHEENNISSTPLLRPLNLLNWKAENVKRKWLLNNWRLLFLWDLLSNLSLNPKFKFLIKKTLCFTPTCFFYKNSFALRGHFCCLLYVQYTYNTYIPIIRGVQRGVLRFCPDISFFPLFKDKNLTLFHGVLYKNIQFYLLYLSKNIRFLFALLDILVFNWHSIIKRGFYIYDLKG